MALTLDQMAQFVTGKVGQTDATSLAQCYGYLNYRFRMIYESFPWRDSQIIPTDVNTVSSQAYVLLPAGVDRVISIRCNGVMLEPSNSTQQLEINPTYLDTTGTPLYYEEYTEVSDNSKRIRLFPIPNAVFALKIIAKRTPNTLAISTDTPILRNIDNVLIAYAMGDMLERQRQYGKAAEKFKEAGALLEAAKQLESAQTNAPRTTKAITFTGDSLVELTDAVSARCGAWSPDNRVLIKDFIRRNYRRVHDSNLWKDVVDNATANTVAAQDYIALPAAFERVVSIGIVANGTMLEPVNSITLAQTDPGIFTRSGTPQFFDEYDNAGAKRIRLLPIPDAIYALTIVGKEVVSAMATDASVLPIRNVANVIIDASCADMLGVMGQKDRAAEFATASQNELKAAVDLEQQQTFRARMAKPLTVSGDSLAEMADAVCSKCGAWAQEAVISAKDFLRRNYQMLWDSELWPESVVMARVNSDGQQIVLPEYFERVLAVRPNDDALYELTPVDVPLYLQVNPQIFAETSDALAYSTLTAVGVNVLPPTNEKFVFVSTSASDKGSVFVRGESLGVEVSETVVLNGTTNVLTANTYDTPLTIAKGITAGTINVTGNTSGAALQTLLATERERKQVRLWLQPAPGVSEAALVIGKRRIKPLVSDEDTPMLRKSANALISAASADLLEQMGKDSKSARERALAALQVLKDGELRQNARQPRVVPFVEPMAYADDMGDAWIVSK